MFRLLKLRPPHGWNAVALELAIVPLGVLIALGAQQSTGNGYVIPRQEHRRELGRGYFVPAALTATLALTRLHRWHMQVRRFADHLYTTEAIGGTSAASP